MGWIIFGAILALIFICLMLRIGLRIKYNEQDGLSATVLLWRIPLKRVYPRKEDATRPRLSRFTPQAIRRREEKRKKLALKKRKKRTDSGAQGARAPRKKTFADKARLVDRISRIVLRVLSRFVKHVRTEVRRFRIRVSAQDAAATAIAYGAASQAAAYLFELLEQKTDLRFRRSARTGVYADFTAESCDADIDITLSLRAHQVAWLALDAAVSLAAHDAERNGNKNI